MSEALPWERDHGRRTGSGGEGWTGPWSSEARDGDHDVFAALATALSGRLYGVAALILRDDDRAKDAVKEALIRGLAREPGAARAGRLGWLAVPAGGPGLPAAHPA